MPTKSDSPEMVWRSLLRTAWKQKLPILVIALLLAAIGVAVVYKLPAIYSADALILVDSQKIPDKFVSSTVSTDLQDRIATISQQILSSTRLKKIIEQFDLYREERKTRFEEEILEMMRKDYSISYIKGWTGNRPGAFRVGYRGPNPNVVAQVANELASLYVAENLKTREIQAEGTSDFIDNQLQEAKKQLDELEAKVSSYKVAHNGELPQQESALNGALGRLQLQFEANRDALNRAEDARLVLANTVQALEANLSLLKAPRPESAPGAAPAAGHGDTRPAVVAARASEIIRSQIDLLKLRYTPDYPDLKRLEAQLAALQQAEHDAALKSLPVRSRTAPEAPPAAANPAPAANPDSVGDPATIAQLAERLAETRTRIAQAEKEISYRKEEQQRIAREMSATQARVGKLPLREQEMAQITRDYEISKANYRSLLDKKNAAEMATDMERRQKSERFTIIDPARAPEKPVQPNRPLLYTLASVLSLVLGLAVGFGREYRKGVLLGEWELPPDLNIIGRLPVIRIAAASEEAGAPQPGKPARPALARRRWAVVASGLLLAIALAVGAYWVTNRS